MWSRVKSFLLAGVPARLRKGAHPYRLHPEDCFQTEAQTVDFLGSSTLENLNRRAPPRRIPSLSAGQVVAGRFEILRFLHSGGMGEVYEAWDSDLKERIALKTIRLDIASSPIAIERFKTEVKQARAISHVNVCRVYEAFSDELMPGDRIWFLTMALLEGPTLSEHLRKHGPFPPAKALELIEQMAAGLTAAHELGIVHRDFKSSNVMLVNAGEGRARAVITDFGLSLKILSELGGGQATREGTRDYMAPEQARGGYVGFAADQYSFGVVVCEMLTGRLPIRPMSVAEKCLLPQGFPSRRWETVIHRALAFRPEDRFKSVSDMVAALNPKRLSRSAWISLAAFVSAAVLVVAALVLGMRGGIRLAKVAQLTPGTDFSRSPSISRDGKVVAYSSDRAESGNLDVWVQFLSGGRPIRVTTDPAEDGEANISPDGSSVVFRSERGGGGIYLAKVSGGGERFLVPGGREPQFSPDGRSIAYWVGDRDTTVASGGLFLLKLEDNATKRLVGDFLDARTPVWSSTGEYVLFNGCRSTDQPMPACSEWWVTSSDGKRIRSTGALALLHREQILPIAVGGWNHNTLLFSGRRGSITSLWELSLSETNPKAVGIPRQLTAGDAREVAASIADDNTVAFEHFTGALHVWRIDDAAKRKPLAPTKVTQDAAVDISPFVSHNGNWLAFSRGSGNQRDIWVKDLKSGTESPFVSSSLDKLYPIISDSGKTIAFEQRDAYVPSIFASIVGQSPKQICIGCSDPTGWFDGDRAVLYREGMPSKIKMTEVSTGKSEVVVEAQDFSLDDGSWSPENQYLLFTATAKDGRKQVFAVSFPTLTQRVTGEWSPITPKSEFSYRPRWSGDGKSIFYLSTRDGFSCVWGQDFDKRLGKATSKPFAVMHYHNPRFSPARVAERSFNLSVAEDTIYLNVGEANASIWTAVMKRSGFLSIFDRWQ
jgi:serine/threonine protein kinase